jgi:hypothetical protein
MPTSSHPKNTLNLTDWVKVPGIYQDYERPVFRTQPSTTRAWMTARRTRFRGTNGEHAAGRKKFGRRAMRTCSGSRSLARGSVWNARGQTEIIMLGRIHVRPGAAQIVRTRQASDTEFAVAKLDRIPSLRNIPSILVDRTLTGAATPCKNVEFANRLQKTEPMTTKFTN